MSAGRSSSYCRRTAAPSRARAGSPRCWPAGRSARPRISVGVARDADGVGREDLVAVVEARQVQPDHVLEQHEGVPAGGVGQRARSAAAPGSGCGARRARCAGRADGAGGRERDRRGRATRLPRYGNGWPGSTASGVSTGSSVRPEVVREEALLILAGRSFGRSRTIPSLARSGWSSSQEAAVLLVTSSWTRAATAAWSRAAVRPSGPAVASPAWMRRFSPPRAP